MKTTIGNYERKQSSANSWNSCRYIPLAYIFFIVKFADSDILIPVESHRNRELRSELNKKMGPPAGEKLAAPRKRLTIVAGEVVETVVACAKFKINTSSLHWEIQNFTLRSNMPKVFRDTELCSTVCFFKKITNIEAQVV